MGKSLRYQVTVWNTTNGDIEQYLSEATQEELDDLLDYYADEPWYDVVVDNEWEEDEWEEQ